MSTGKAGMSQRRTVLAADVDATPTLLMSKASTDLACLSGLTSLADGLAHDGKQYCSKIEIGERRELRVLRYKDGLSSATTAG